MFTPLWNNGKAAAESTRDSEAVRETWMAKKTVVTNYVTYVTVIANQSIMTKFADSLVAAALDAEKREQAQQVEREVARAELDGMSQAMIEEEGLLNHVQAGLLLGVSVKRIGELVRLGKLRRFDFLGRTYVSVREVRERYHQELKAGRPRRGLAQSAVASVKAALKTDAAQAKLGGFAGPYEKAKRKGKAK